MVDKQMFRERIKSTDWGVFSEFRPELMGFSILFIVIFHWSENYHTLLNHVPTLLNPMYLVGASGVEMFLFLSGIGLYFSWTRKPQLRPFWKKRFFGIIISYLIIALPYLLWQDFIYTHVGVRQFLVDLSMLNAFESRNRQCWYAAMILVMYLLFPLFYVEIKRFGTPGAAVLIIVFALLPYVLERRAVDVFNTYQVGLTRIPFFILGVACGKKVEKKERFRLFPVLLLLGAACFLLLKGYRTDLELRTTMCSRYSHAFIALIILTAVAVLLKLFQPVKIRQFLCFFSPFTFELYLLHVEMRRVFARTFKGSWTFSSVTLAYIIILAISIPLALWISRRSRRLQAALQK